jgi:hydrogenase expression/formation protein HypD
MKRALAEIKSLAADIAGPIRLMEVCGTHTVAIFRHGLRDLIPKNISLLSGPGCPVCVTPVRDVDLAIELSRSTEIILTTFGDMMRVPGSRKSLYEARAEGADIRVVYSPMDALKTAGENPSKNVVFLATGFETTSPLIAATLSETQRTGRKNFYIHSAHKLVPPALKALLDSGDVLVDGFILPGHVSTIIGKAPYEFIPIEYKKPSVITGFEASEIIRGILMLLRQIASGRAEVEIEYTKAVRPEGNPKGISLIRKYFMVVNASWRGIGEIPKSGLLLKKEFKSFDAVSKFKVEIPPPREPKACSCGDILRGKKSPPECALFGRACTPERPVGACMVSTEGSCAAWYKYGERNG